MEVKGEGGQNIKSPEAVLNFDFRKIFLEKLKKIEPIPEKDRKYKADGLEAIGIKSLKRRAPALLLLNLPKNKEGEREFGLWITDPSLISDFWQPHFEVEKDLSIFLGININDSKFPKYSIGAEILQDDDDKLYLLMNEGPAETLDVSLKNDKLRIRLLDLLQSYEITRVAGSFPRVHQEVGVSSTREEIKILLDEDLIGKRREDLYLLKFAKEYNMNNTQYMRFRIMVKSITDAVKKKDLFLIEKNINEIAQEIIDEK